MATPIDFSKITFTGGTSVLGGPTQQSFDYGGKSYSAIKNAGEQWNDAYTRVINGGQSDYINKDPVSGYVSADNKPMSSAEMDAQNKARGYVDQPNAQANAARGNSSSQQSQPQPNTAPSPSNPALFAKPGESFDQYEARMLKTNGVPKDPITGAPQLSAEQINKYLAMGSDPSTTFNPETSSGSQTAGQYGYDANGNPLDKNGSPIYSSSPNGPAISSMNLPYPNLGDRPTPPDPNLQDTLYQDHVAGIQDQISSIDQKIADLTNQENAKVQSLLSETGVSTRYSSKEAAMAKRGFATELQALRAQKTILTNQASMATKAISLIMSTTDKTYADASKQWTEEYSQNQKYINQMDKASTADVKTAKTMVQSVLNSLTPGAELSTDQKTALDAYVAQAYGAEFVGIESAGLSGTLYSHTVSGADGKKYLMTLSGKPDGTYDIKYTSTAKPTTTNYGTVTKGDYGKLQNAFGVSESYVNGIIDSYTSGTSLDDIRKQMRKDGVDTTALDSIMRYYDPIHNTPPSSAASTTF